MVSSEEDNKHFKSFFEDVVFIKLLLERLVMNKTKEYKVWILKGYIK